MTSRLKILVVDDHPLILDGFISNLKQVGSFDITASNNCDDAFLRIKSNYNETPFTIVFTDLSFENSTNNSIDGGEALIKTIREADINIKIAVVTSHSETNRIFHVIQNLKPDAYILKTKCEKKDLEFAIHKMLNNEFYYTHEVHQKIMRRNIIQIQMDDVAIQILKALPNYAKLSNLEGVIKKPNGTVLKMRSIENKLSNLRADLNANNNTDLVLKAKELGIID